MYYVVKHMQPVLSNLYPYGVLSKMFGITEHRTIYATRRTEQ